MVAVNNLLNRESAADESIVLDPKDAERMLAQVAAKQGKVMVDAGYAVFIAARSGVSNARAAEIFGKSPSTITLYRRLGKFMVIGGEPTGQTWNLLANKSKANDKRIGAVIDADDVTVEAIEAALTEFFTPEGKSRTPKTTDANPSGTGDGDLPPLETTLALLKLVEESLPALGREDWATVETRIVAIREAQVARMVEAAKQAAPKGKAAKQAAAK